MRCNTCNKEYTPECDHKQGRCPHHPPLIEIPIWRQSVYLFFAPLLILVWCIMNPSKVWEQAKKDWNLNDQREQEETISGCCGGPKGTCNKSDSQTNK